MDYLFGSHVGLSDDYLQPACCLGKVDLFLMRQKIQGQQFVFSNFGLEFVHIDRTERRLSSWLNWGCRYGLLLRGWSQYLLTRIIENCLHAHVCLRILFPNSLKPYRDPKTHITIISLGAYSSIHSKDSKGDCCLKIALRLCESCYWSQIIFIYHRRF